MSETAFYVRGGTLTMNGGSISGHHISSAKGGAIYCSSYAKVYLNGGTITYNSATKAGNFIFYSAQ